MSRILFGVQETCGILNMSRTALYAAIKQGRIKAVKNGFRTLFHRDEIERFAASLTRA
ncbi:MAG: helix-turn-helix domain-containing protein [Roseomonas sp.]|jgi:excisionase family DNA binding protein|nr:helix-turn-helix domain-containing protein [Roseomonas sp.]